MAHKFTIDEVIELVPANSIKKRMGKIVGLSYNSMFGDEEYIVEWFDDGQRETYPCDMGDRIFIKPFASLPTGFSLGSYHPSNPEQKAECDHEWRLYTGFIDSYEFCNKCDKKRGQGTNA